MTMFSTRRRFLAIGAGLGAGLQFRARADDSWAHSHPDEWTPHEIDTVLNHSPWIHEAVLAVPVSTMAPQRGKVGPIEQGSGVPSEFAVLVRWESALPVRLAHHTPPAAEEGGQTRYLLSVNRLPLPFIGDALGREPNRARMTEDQIKARVAAAVLRTAILQRAGKNPIHATTATWAEGTFSPSLFVEFRPAVQPIQREDPTVTLVAEIDTLVLRAVFFPKKMSFRGKLEL